MKRITLVFVLVIGNACAGKDSIDLNVVSIEKEAVVIEVRNPTSEAIVILSPETPHRQVDDERCALFLSTRVTNGILPYAFTPTLVTVEARSERRVRAILAPAVLTKSCSEWMITAEYAYVRPEDVDVFKGRAHDDFRRFVLRNQRLLTKETVLLMKE